MKIFISVDIEGVAGVTNWEHVRMGEAEYVFARRWMTEEVNAAIAGAKEAGATEFTVTDSHSAMYNIMPDLLDKDALLVRGSPRPLFQMEGIDASFAAAFLIGYHCMAGTPKATLCHSHLGDIVYEMRLNGVPIGEAAYNAAVAGAFEVPVVLTTGEDTYAAEVERFLPWTERVITKWAITQWSAKNLNPKVSQERIKAGAKQALARLPEMKPFLPSKPVRFEVDFTHPIHAQLAGDLPGVERIGGRTLAYTGPSMIEVNRMWRLIINSGQNRLSV